MLDLELVFRLGVGLLAGVIVGWQRTIKHKSAGIRTFGLVGVGTAAAAAIFSAELHPDSASRAIQGVLTGIGFLGAGMIVRRDADRSPHGLTTAAAIWVTAALGCAAGVGRWQISLIAAGFALVLLALDHSIEHWARGRRPDEPPPEEGAEW